MRMKSEGLRERKVKTTAASPNRDTTDTTEHSACARGEVKKNGGDCWSAVDIRTVMSCLSLIVCFLLAWAILLQNARFSEVEEKYNNLYEKAADLLALEKKFSATSRMLETSEDHLNGAHSSRTMLTELQQDVTSLSGIVTAMQEDQHVSSRHLQSVNERFLNVTETWQGGLATITKDLMMLRSESRSVHGRVTERVNEAEERLRALTKRLEELEDSTKRNGRALERTEEEDAKSIQNHLDWNTKHVSRLQEQLVLLSKRDVEFEEKLVEMEPQAKECEAQLPAVEDAVRSILRLGADLSGVETRLEELTLQVVGTEDSLLKALTEILQLRQTLDDLQVDNSVSKVTNELGVVLDAMKELERMRRDGEEDLDRGREVPEHDEGREVETLNIKQLNDDVTVLEESDFTDSTAGQNESGKVEEYPAD